MINEKVKVALTSVIAAVFLTILKLVVGLTTGSLGIISEAIHSGLDLGAALLTLFAVRISDKPADKTHHYGHGKVENFSALIQTALLLATCGWIVFEAVSRLIEPKEVQVIPLSYVVIIAAIIIDISRSVVLMKAAKKYNSQALEADAYHFSSDILSSIVVIIGLISVQLGFPAGDSIAALIVSAVVIIISLRLGKRTVEVLMDSAPAGAAEKIEDAVLRVQGVTECRNIRVRASGSYYFVDINAGINRHLSHREIQDTTYRIRAVVREVLPNCDVFVSTYPANITLFKSKDEAFFDEVMSIVNSLDVCINLHHMKVFNVDNLKHIALHIEINDNMGLKETHELSHLIESKIKDAIPGICGIDILVESMKQEQILVEDVTESSREIIKHIETMINKVPHKLNCHDIKMYRQNDKVIAFLHCGLQGEFSNHKIQEITRRIVRKIKRNIYNVEDVYIHVEPMNH